MNTDKLKDKYKDLLISLCIELSPAELKHGEDLRRESKLRREAIRLQQQPKTDPPKNPVEGETP